MPLGTLDRTPPPFFKQGPSALTKLMVFSALAIREGILYPNLRFQKRIPDLDFDPVRQLQEHVDIRHVLSNSFGFGGACSSLILSAC